MQPDYKGHVGFPARPEEWVPWVGVHDGTGPDDPAAVGYYCKCCGGLLNCFLELQDVTGAGMYFFDRALAEAMQFGGMWDENDPRPRPPKHACLGVVVRDAVEASRG